MADDGERPRRIMSEDFGRALIGAGLIPGPADAIRRIVIDVQGGEPLAVYVEYYGDERWLDIAPLVTGAQIITRR
jgi:hypothetical protein